jgi:hypothetical protein
LKKKKDPKKSSKLLTKFLSIVAFAFIAVGVFYGTYYFMIDKSASSYESNIKGHINTITLENQKVSAFIKNGTIDSSNSSNIIKGLNDITAAFNTLKSTLENEVPTDKYKTSHQNLIEGLNNNILTYKQIASMLQNLSSADLDKSLTDLDKYKADTVKNYSLFSVDSIKVSLPKESDTFINSAIKYISEISKANKDLAIKSAQNLEFSDKLDSVIAKFLPLKIDFSLQLQKVRTKEITYDILLASIDEYKSNYLSVKKDFTTIIVPSKTDAVKIHTNFSNILTSYNLYLQELSFAVSNEKNKANESKTPLSEEALKSLYSSANNKYLTLDNDYAAFSKAYTTFKSVNFK